MATPGVKTLAAFGFTSVSRPASSPVASPLPVEAAGLAMTSTVAVPSDREVQCSDEDDGSDSDADELEALFRARQAASSSLPRPPTPVSRKRPPPDAIWDSSPLRIAPKYHYDIKSLASLAASYRAGEAALLKAHESLKTGPHMLPGPDASRTVLLGNLADDEGSADKVLKAVQRTESMHTTLEWRFFRTSPRHILQSTLDFPTQAAVGPFDCLREPALRYAALISGLPGAMVRQGNALPPVLLSWAFQQVAVQPRRDVRQACADLVRDAGHFHLNLGPSEVSQLFCLLGAGDDFVDLANKLDTHAQTKMDSTASSPQRLAALQSALILLGQLSTYFDTNTSTYTLSLVFRLCTDSTLTAATGTCAAISALLLRLCPNLPEFEWMEFCDSWRAAIISCVDSAALRLQILRNLPVELPRLHALRRQLAIVSFFAGTAASAAALRVTLSISSLIERLSNDPFNMGTQTNYAELSALVGLLDMVVDDGSRPCHARTDLSYFTDMEVDALADRLKKIYSSIHDAGARYMSRVNAKECIEALRYRLVYSVRGAARVKIGIFDPRPANSLQMSRQADFMKSTFKSQI